MLKQYVQRMKHVITDDVVVKAERVCDCCGEVITGPFYTIFTQRTDWGNNNVDSSEYRDYCSDKCVKWAIENYLEDIHGGTDKVLEITTRDNPISVQEQTTLVNDENDILSVQHIRVD